MATCFSNTFSCSYSTHQVFDEITVTKPSVWQFWGNLLYEKPVKWGSHSFHFRPVLSVINAEQIGRAEVKEEKPRFKWIEIGPNVITEEQKQAISQLPPKMTKRCKSLIKQIICFSPEKGSLSELLSAWVRIMKPRRNDWLAVLKQLKREYPHYFEVAELALDQESFEANIRDYTKLIHGYGKQNQLQNAENTLLAMKRRGFIWDQVTLTTMVHMYSKAGNLKQAEETFEEIKLLGEPLDKRSYGAMIMAYIRAGMPYQGEVLLGEMDAQEIYAGSEVYKALLRAYSMIGDSEGAQRVFEAIQFAAITPDAKMCALLINGYLMARQSQKAYIAFENMIKVGLEPSDKCVALVLSAYEKENKIKQALELLINLERDGFLVGKEASSTLAAWFRKLGVVEETEHVLREANCKITKSTSKCETGCTES